MKSSLNVNVSYFEGYFDTEPKEANLWDLLNDQSQIKQIKKIQNTPDKKDREALKSHIRQITISGTFKEVRLIENLVSHSGLICIDIDLQDNEHIENYQNLKNIISTAPFVAYISKSVSGLGLFVIVPIENPKKHVEHFLALETLFSKMGIKIDKACKDVTRMRCTSYDPEPYVNHQAQVFKSIIEIPAPKIRNTNFQYNHLEGDSTQSWVERYIKELTGRRIDITGSYYEWVNQGFALASEFGENGRDYFHDISSIHPDYDADKCDKQYDRCVKRNGTGVKIGSFFHACKVAGVDLKGFNINYDNTKPAKANVRKSTLVQSEAITRNLGNSENQAVIEVGTYSDIKVTALNTVKPTQKETNRWETETTAREDILTEKVPEPTSKLFDIEEYKSWLKTVTLPTGYINLNGQVEIWNLGSFLKGRLDHVSAFTNYRDPGNRSLFIRQLKFVRRHFNKLATTKSTKPI